MMKTKMKKAITVVTSLLSDLRDSDAKKRAWAVDVALRVQESGLDIEQVFLDARKVHEYYKGRNPTATIKELTRVK